MNYAYTVCSLDFWRYGKIGIASLMRKSACHLWLVTYGWSQTGLGNLDRWFEERFPERCTVYQLMPQEWLGRRMSCKIVKLAGMPLQEGDNLLAIDADMVFRADPFWIFEDKTMEHADVFLTERHYEYHYPVNGGLWGVRMNGRGRQFLDFFIGQVRAPSWPPLVEWMERFNHVGKRDWFVDQDFLCAVSENVLPFECGVSLLSPAWNYCPTVEEDQPETWGKANREMEAAEKNPWVKVLHYKGRLKERMMEVWQD